MGPLSLLIKPVSSSCNLRCKYCFYFDEVKHREVKNYGVMSEETLEEMIKKAFDYANGQMNFFFQGGEPTMAGLEYFKTFISLVKKYNRSSVQVFYSIQTNGILIDSEWAQFLKEHNFLVGLSLDGTEEIHDRYRVDSSGMGTYERVLKATELLKENSVDFNILTVVNKIVAKNPQEIYQSYKDRDFRYLQFIPCMDELEGVNEDFSLSPKDYGEFLIKIYDLWERDIYNRRFVNLRFLNNLLLIIANYEPEACSMRGFCSPNIVIEADGSAYPCDFFALDQWRLGNLLENSIEELFSNKTMYEFLKSSRNLDKECRNCDYLSLCRGGCRRYKQNGENEIPGKHRFCISFKMFYKERLDSLFKLYRYICENPLEEV